MRKFIYGPGIDEPICMIDVADSNTVYYYHFDGLGSVVALSDSTGNIVEQYSYDVFGEPNRTTDVNNPYLFTGRRYDNESGLYYYRARYYKPAIGRFLQTDPIRYDDGLNLYTCVGNNPIMFIDPLGLDTIAIHARYGHAWITYIHDSGYTQTFGLWHMSRARLKSGGHRYRPDSDLWRNIERSNPNIYRPIGSRYYNNLTRAQIQNFNRWISTPHKYEWPTYNCASWASDTIRQMIGEDVDADDWSKLGAETPDKLIESIQKLESEDPTKNEIAHKNKNKDS